MKKITFLLMVITITFGYAQTPEGTWKMNPDAGAFGVGPNQGDTSWFANSAADVTARDCYFDDEFVFNADGSFNNVNGTDTWVEAWQDGAGDGCRASVAPHDGSNAASWAYDQTGNTITLTGVGAYLGLAKAYNGGELSTPGDAPASITYMVSEMTETQMTLDISIGGGWWRFVMQKQVEASPLEGTWRLNPAAGAMGVGPNQGDTSWWSNSAGDVTTRACLFDDDYVFNMDGSFSNVLGVDSWIENWQDGMGEGCRTPVAPHDGSGTPTYVYDNTTNTITLNGTGAYLGLAKVNNAGELTSPAAAPASITYMVSEITATLMTLDINFGGGWWRFVLQKQGVAPTCDDGIMNGDETGIDCGGSCPNVCLAQIDHPVDFEGTTTDYTTTDFGGNASSLVADPTDPSNMVVKVIKTEAAELWAGTTIGTNTGFASNIPLTAAQSKMYVKIWSPDAGIPIRLKVEDSSDPTHTCETEVMTTTAGAWETLEFDFNNEAPGTAALATGAMNGWTYNMASIFFNFGTTGQDAKRAEKTYYFDNVAFNEPLLSVDTAEASVFNVYPNPTQNIWNVKSTQNINAVQVYDISGKLVISLKPNLQEVTLDATSLNSGLYFAKLYSEAGTKTIKLVRK